MKTIEELFFAHRGLCSDKWEGYLDAYEFELAPFRTSGRPIDLLEIGVQEGGSLQIWQSAFAPGSRIAGLDIDPAVMTLPFGPGIEVAVGDASSPAVLQAVFPGRTFDIVIDDGSHRCADVIATFDLLFSRLKPGGIYVIEDLHCSYWPSHGGGLRNAASSMEWLKGFADAIHADHWAPEDDTAGIRPLQLEQRAWIERIAIYDSIAVLSKRRERGTARKRQVLTGSSTNHSGNLAAVTSFFSERPADFIFSEDYAALVDAELARRGMTGTVDPASSIYGRPPLPRAPATPPPAPALDDALQAMIDHVSAQAEVFRPARFWTYFNERNLRQLTTLGLSRFKRTINQNYYNWIPSGPGDNQFTEAARHWAANPDMAAFRVKLGDVRDLEGFFDDNPLLTASGRELYCAFVGLLWHLARTEVPNGLCDSLTEPPLGDPIPTTLDGRPISQDLATSIRERNTILAPFEAQFASGRQPSVVEIGAGYGRLGYVLLASSPCRYTVVDVPPALYVSQWYLTTLNPTLATFRFRPWSDFETVRAELAGARLAFLTPDQLAKVPAGFFDVGVAISNMAEMSRNQVTMYLDEFDRTVGELVYIKQWVAQENGLDGESYRRSDFDMRPGWRPTVDRLDAIQNQFFETLWVRETQQLEATPDP